MSGLVHHKDRCRAGYVLKPEPHATYMVETTWMDVDLLRSETTTFTLAPGEVEVLPENILDEGIKPDARDDTLKIVRKARVGQLCDSGVFVRCRMFKVLDVVSSQSVAAEKIELRSYTLQPLFDLDDGGRVSRIG